MPFNPHTESDVATMLEAVGVPEIRALFNEIPAALMISELSQVPERIPEMEIVRVMHARAARDGSMLNFIGAGAYEHHIPAAVWEITTRGEFYSAYTPYQAEASQGTLQLIYEFQTMMTGLTGLDVSNASLYDGASALAEAVLMAVRARRGDDSRRILVLGTVNPLYRRVMQAIAGTQDIRFDEIPFCNDCGSVLPEALEAHAGDGFTAVVIQHPNFFGGLEAVDAVTDWAHSHDALVIASVNPTALALLKPPGEWGTPGEKRGADIACGEGQPLGIPLSSGGPYFGFLTCKQALVRQMPGRIVGRTVDLDGREGFTLTLQAREQHIRRSKATSNICTNQGLMVTAATIYMALLGQEGLRRVAASSHANTVALIDALTAIPGVQRVFDGPVFHEAVLRLERPVEPVLEALANQGIVGGYALNDHFPELGEALLICATETRTEADIRAYADALDRILSR